MKTLEKIATNQAFGAHTKPPSHVHWVPILAAMACLLFLVFSRDVHSLPPVQTAPSGIAPSGGAIYKLVDANGRVTYSNTPAKGAAKVELDPITVIPGSPSGSLGDAVRDKAALAIPPAPLLIPVDAPALATIAPVPVVQPAAIIAPSASPRAVAQVTPVTPAKIVPAQVVKVSRDFATESLNAPSPSPSANPLGLPVVKLRPDGGVPAPSAMASTAAAMVAEQPAPEAIAQAKREAARQKMMMSNIADEERILAEVKELLATERRQSDTMRALRSGLVNSPDAKKTATNDEVRAQVERHFERVRDLQDQVAMHERNIADMRQKLRGDALAAR
jgi:hypothetical protein